MRGFDYAASGYRLDLTPGRVFYFYHDCTRFSNTCGQCAGPETTKKPGRSDGSVPVLAFGAYAFQAFVCSRSQSAHGSMPSPLSAEIGNT